MRFLPVLVLVAIWSGRAHAELRKPTHVACVGDSITLGFGLTPDQSYPYQLQNMLGAGVEVRNFGRSGATVLRTGDLPYREQPEFRDATEFVDGAGPDAVVSVIIMLGTNDSRHFNWKAQEARRFAADYRALVAHFRRLASKPAVYVALPLSTGDEPCCAIQGEVLTREIVPVLQQLATEYQLPLIDLHTPTVGHPEYFQDGVHPTADGSTVVATLMKQGLEQDVRPAAASIDAVDESATSEGCDLGMPLLWIAALFVRARRSLSA